jgi:siroheme decarboxylase
MDTAVHHRAALDPQALLNAWQRDLPLVARPFAALGEPHGLDSAEVCALIGAGLSNGQVSRIGAVFGVGAGGSGMLCALRVPDADLERVAAIVNAEPGVNHNYAREHEWNLWFVATASDVQALLDCVTRIERATGLAALRLPMRRAYRIDLGFDLFEVPRNTDAPRRRTHEPAGSPQGLIPKCAARRHSSEASPVAPALRPLAARLEDGVPLVERPFAAIGAPLGMTEDEVIAVLRGWCEAGTLRRLGVVLRHHEFGIAANAMTVFEVPESEADAFGTRLAAQPGVTLCYRRASAPGWPYTVYCMVHGRERAAVQRLIDEATEAAGLAGLPREVLFSTRRYKQTGARYFAQAAA